MFFILVPIVILLRAELCVAIGGLSNPHPQKSLPKTVILFYFVPLPSPKTLAKGSIDI